MINTDKSVRYMPRNLAAFKRYAETYDCTFFVTTSLHFGELNYALLFYHNETDMPYVLVYVRGEDEAPLIYANYQADNWDSMFMKVAATVNEIVRMYLESEGVKVVEDGYEEITLELTSKELENLRSMASAANMSVNRFVSFKLKSALADGTFERLAKNWKEENTEKAGG